MTNWPANPTIGFAHPAYALGAEFAGRGRGEPVIEARSLDELKARAADIDVLVVSGLWRNELIPAMPRLRFIQSVSAGTDQFDKAALGKAGIRLASAQGANERAVAEHAMALILAVARRIPEACAHQAQGYWRPMIADRGTREAELGGKTLVIVGMGRIGARLARLASAFDMRVIGVRRQPQAIEGVAECVTPDRMHAAMGEADYVALTCPLTPETENLIDAAALAAMRPEAHLINIARGKVVVEPALIAALEQGRIAGAALDCTVEEPLPASSPLWGMKQVLITPHSAGETRAYETNVVDLLVENLDRLARGEGALRNQMV